MFSRIISVAFNAAAFASRYTSTTPASPTTSKAMPNINKRVPGVDTFYPLNEPVIGTAYSESIYPQNKQLPTLFQPITIRNVEFVNRIFIAPMCMYSSDDGHATDWHLVHIGNYARSGVAAIIMEASSVVPEGRITPEDAGLWKDSQIAPLKRVVDFAHTQGVKIGIQLAHAGRKASTMAPWVHSDPAHQKVAKTYVAEKDEGGWPDNVFGPSSEPFSDVYPKPKEMTIKDMEYVADAFVAAARRCKAAGFDFIEVHAAHGYLLHSWLSPLSNLRTDAHGGSLENRMKYPLQLVEKVRKVWEGPLFVRISATDFAEGPEKGEDGEWKSWGIEQSKIFVTEMQKLGVDFLDVSAGGNWAKQKIPVGPGYQVPFADEIKKAHPNLAVGTVGLITEAKQAESYLSKGQADVVLLAREFLRNPNWPFYAAQELGVAIKAPNQYERSWPKMLTPAKPNESVRERAKEQGSS